MPRKSKSQKSAELSSIKEELCGDEFESDFWLGWSAFEAGVGIGDNPHFAEAAEVEQFDAWSDGWHQARDLMLPPKGRFLTWLKAKRGWGWLSLRGLTATWGAGAAR